MIKLKPILNKEIKVIPKKYILVTNKGREALNHYYNLYKAVNFFHLYKYGFDTNELVFEGTLGPLIEASANLTILIDEKIMNKDKPILKQDFIKNIKFLYDDEDIFQTKWFQNIFKQELLIEK